MQGGAPGLEPGLHPRNIVGFPSDIYQVHSRGVWAANGHLYTRVGAACCPQGAVWCPFCSAGPSHPPLTFPKPAEALSFLPLGPPCLGSSCALSWAGAVAHTLCSTHCSSQLWGPGPHTSPPFHIQNPFWMRTATVRTPSPALYQSTGTLLS